MNRTSPGTDPDLFSETHHTYRRMLGAIIVAFVLLALSYSAVNPVFESPDEAQHFFTAWHIAQGRGFARPDPDEPWFQEAAQAPLYYLLTAALIAPIDTSDGESLLWRNQFAATGGLGTFGNKNQVVHTGREAWPYRESVLAVHVSRAFSILLGAATLALLYGIARLLVPAAPRVALAAAALTALTPQFIYLSSSVTNDNVTNTTVTLAVFVLLQGLRGRRFRGWAVVLGLALGLVGLSKVSGLLLWPLIGFTILLVGWRRGQLRRTLPDLVVIGVLAGAVAGWWYARNWLVYGDPTGVSSIVTVADQTPTSGTWNVMVGELRALRFSYWGLFGWFNILSPVWLYQAMHYLAALALLGLPLAWVPRLIGGRRALIRPADMPWLLVPAIWLALMLAALFRYDRMLPALQGRLLMPAAWAINLFLALGWAGLVLAIARLTNATARRLRWLAPRLVAAAPLGLLAAWAVMAPFAIIAPVYAWPARLRLDQVPLAMRRAAVDFGQYARFLGGAPAQNTVRPGGTLQTTAYWQALSQFPKDYTAFVHALGPDGQAVAGANGWPGRGNYPTRLWQPGEVVVDEQQMTIPWEADEVAPALLTLDAGFFLYPSNELLAGHTTDGQPARSLLGQVRLLPVKPPVVQPAVALGAEFGDGIRLLGYTLTPGAAIQAGTPVTLTLYWDSSVRPQADWTVFVHLRPKSGGAQIQADGPPRGGGWPTSAWEPGYAVEDPHRLQITADAARGPAELWIGLYGKDGARLPIARTEGRTEDQALYLQDVTIKP